MMLFRPTTKHRWQTWWQKRACLPFGVVIGRKLKPGLPEPPRASQSLRPLWLLFLPHKSYVLHYHLTPSRMVVFVRSQNEENIYGQGRHLIWKSFFCCCLVPGLTSGIKSAYLLLGFNLMRCCCLLHHASQAQLACMWVFCVAPRDPNNSEDG